MTSELIREIKVQGRDGEGKPETATIRITRTEEGLEVDWLVDDVIVDSTTCDTRAEAESQARTWSIVMARDYERERKAEERRGRRQTVNSIVDCFDGHDAQILRMVAALIGQGRSKAAVEALRAINQRRRRDV
jgi:hypothetical protein